MYVSPSLPLSSLFYRTKLDLSRLSFLRPSTKEQAEKRQKEIRTEIQYLSTAQMHQMMLNNKPKIIQSWSSVRPVQSSSYLIQDKAVEKSSMNNKEKEEISKEQEKTVETVTTPAAAPLDPPVLSPPPPPSPSLSVLSSSPGVLRCLNILEETVTVPDIFRGKITLLTVSYNQHSMNHANIWCEKFNQITNNQWDKEKKILSENVSATPTLSRPTLPLSPPSIPFIPSLYQSYQFSMLDSALIRFMLSGIALANTRKMFPFERHPFICIINSTENLNLLHNHNELQLRRQHLMCHVLLIDGQGRVRWRAWTDPQGNDLDLLQQATSQLQKEMLGQGTSTNKPKRK